MPIKDIDKRREYFRRYRKEHKEQTYASWRKYVESHPDYYKKAYERRKERGTAYSYKKKAGTDRRRNAAIRRRIEMLESQKSVYVAKIESLDIQIAELKRIMDICKEN